MAPVAPRLARQEFRERNGHLPEGVLKHVELLLSELVTNAVLHGAEHSPIGIEVAESPECVRVAVTNSGPAFAWRAPPDPSGLQVGGRGLLIVRQTARAWGLTRGEDANTVWFEIALA